jgi:DNA-binding LacI/PurR family transcriptional regulator
MMKKANTDALSKPCCNTGLYGLIWLRCKIKLERNGGLNIKKIAQLAGVHPSTVSRALNGSNLVKPETRERIEKIAQEGGYIRDSLAKSLIVGKTYTLGILAPEISSTFYSQIIDEIENAVSMEGYGIIIAATNFQYLSEKKALNSMLSKRVDALVICAPSDQILNDFRRMKVNIPLVLCDTTHEDIPFNDVYVDEKQGIREAVLYLAKLGHREIGFIGEEKITRHRLDNFLIVMKECGLKLRKDYIRLESGVDSECGYKAVRQFLRERRFPTAILCARDTIAIGAVRAAVENGIRVPDYISIVGYDDINVSRYLLPALTTIRQLSEEIGRQAGKMLLGLIEDDSETKPVTHIVLTPKLVVRESTSVPRS